MENILYSNLINLIKNYDKEAIETIERAYKYASYLHYGQYRQSGEAYITHPLNVAIILASYHADRDTICAALLHDVLEDASDKTNKQEISKIFNENVANLVDGVTKINKLNFSTRKEETAANTRKITIGLTNDVRIIIIKLADRLHNMRTLEFKSEFKQKENAIETLELFVPFAKFLGIYQMKNELEDLSFKYLDKDEYMELELIRNKLIETEEPILIQMRNTIINTLKEYNIDNNANYRIKNIYGLHKRKLKQPNIDTIHDLISIKVAVDTIPNCYYALGLIHSKYKPINNKFKDYICNPKTNDYRSLHTTVYGPNDHLIQTQIRTQHMDNKNRYGITNYWNTNPKNASVIMQHKLKKYQFYDSLVKIDKSFSDNAEFIKEVKNKLFNEKVYIYNSLGEIIEMPKGSTLDDYFQKTLFKKDNYDITAIVNNDFVEPNYILKNKDRVRILTNYNIKKPNQKAKKLS